MCAICGDPGMFLSETSVSYVSIDLEPHPQLSNCHPVFGILSQEPGDDILKVVAELRLRWKLDTGKHIVG